MSNLLGFLLLAVTLGYALVLLVFMFMLLCALIESVFAQRRKNYKTGGDTYVGESEQTFATIMADPPWAYQNFGAKKHGAARGHYAGSAAEVIGSIPVSQWARKDSNLLLWGVNTKADEAIDVMRAWGFGLVTMVPWVKTVPSKEEIAKGIGFWFYGPAEYLLICRKGNTKAPKYKSAKDKPDGFLVGDKASPVFYARRGPHSRKPLSLIEWTESYLPGPYLELFATGERPGWTCWGEKTGYWLSEDGVEKFDEDSARDS